MVGVRGERLLCVCVLYFFMVNLFKYVCVLVFVRKMKYFLLLQFFVFNKVIMFDFKWLIKVLFLMVFEYLWNKVLFMIERFDFN